MRIHREAHETDGARNILWSATHSVAVPMHHDPVRIANKLT